MINFLLQLAVGQQRKRYDMRLVFIFGLERCGTWQACFIPLSQLGEAAVQLLENDTYTYPIPDWDGIFYHAVPLPRYPFF